MRHIIIHSPTAKPKLRCSLPMACRHIRFASILHVSPLSAGRRCPTVVFALSRVYVV
jgi:hypothetical protein